MPNSARAMDPAEFERVVEVDLLGVYRTVQAALGHMIARRGQVVLVSSVYAFMNRDARVAVRRFQGGRRAAGRALRVELARTGASATVAYFGFVDTKMVQDAMDREDAADRQELVPELVRRRITPAQAGEAVAEGVLRRRARVIAPRWWTALSVLRGVVNPAFDFLTARQQRVQDAIRDAEAAAAAASSAESASKAAPATPNTAKTTS